MSTMRQSHIQYMSVMSSNFVTTANIMSPQNITYTKWLTMAVSWHTCREMDGFKAILGPLLQIPLLSLNIPTNTLICLWKIPMFNRTYIFFSGCMLHCSILNSDEKIEPNPSKINRTKIITQMKTTLTDADRHLPRSQQIHLPKLFNVKNIRNRKLGNSL